jgi:ABC-2 type transport system ATP-binding protein
MSSDDIAISVKNINKSFKLPHEKQASIKGLFLSMFNGKKTYEEQQVLKDINLDIKKGEFFGIVGRNGSGKSTLLKLLAEIYTPNSGRIQVNGKLTPFIELGVGFNPELTGRENVFLNGALLGFSRTEMEAMYDEIVEFAELEKFMDQKLKNYSSGMQVRLAFSVAIRANTEILLIDEVLAVGDQSFQEKCFGYFAKMKNSGKTMVLVTHDMSSVERFCDRVFIIDKKSKFNGMYDIPTAVSIYNKLNHEIVKNESKLENTGDKPLFIDAVRLVNEKGKQKESFEQGEPLSVEIDIKRDATAKKEDVVIGLAFHDKDNVNISGPNSIGSKISSESGTVTYTIDKIPFNMGEYFLTVALLNDNATIYHDLLDKRFSFFVNTRKTYGGKVILKDKWSTSK